MVAIPGTWSPLANNPPWQFGIGQLLQLTGGDILVNALDNGGVWGTNWLRLTPNAKGDYLSGTWKQAEPNHVARFAFPAVICEDGWPVIAGGEQWRAPDGSTQANGNAVETYDPVADRWYYLPALPWPSLSNAPMTLLNSGEVLAGAGNRNCYRLRKAAGQRFGSWTQTGSRLDASSAEQAFCRLPDGDVLAINARDASLGQTAWGEVYSSATQKWTSTGLLPYNFMRPSSTYGSPALLQDGRVWWIGGDGRTLFYDYTTRTWAAGPDLPDLALCFNGQLTVLPTGRVLFVAGGGQDTNPTGYQGPMRLYEFDPSDNSFIDVTPPRDLTDCSAAMCLGRLLLLPSGQVLFSSDQMTPAGLAIYTPSGSPSVDKVPVVNSVVKAGGIMVQDLYMLFGKQLRGWGEGSCGCGTAQGATDYPLVQLTDAAGRVQFARTGMWMQSFTQFHVPPGFVPASLRVICNGIASLPFTIGAS